MGTFRAAVETEPGAKERMSWLGMKAKSMVEESLGRLRERVVLKVREMVGLRGS